MNIWAKKSNFFIVFKIQFELDCTNMLIVQFKIIIIIINFNFKTVKNKLKIACFEMQEWANEQNEIWAKFLLCLFI